MLSPQKIFSIWYAYGKMSGNSVRISLIAISNEDARRYLDEEFHGFECISLVYVGRHSAVVI